MPDQTIGFVGTGAIAEAMVRGLLSAPAVASKVVVSPRNVEVASRLATEFPAVHVAEDNQTVVDLSDILVLSVRPQIAEEVIRALRFRGRQPVISVIATMDRRRLFEWIDVGVILTQAIPLPFVANREGVTAIFPPDKETSALFASLGTAVECETKEEYDLLAVASALMETYLGVLENAVAWMEQQGMTGEKARAYLAPLFLSLAQAAVRNPHITLDVLKRGFSTPGGLNEQAFQDFSRLGGGDALRQAMNGILRRFQASNPVINHRRTD
jgi:pyrroline-5-carboxylate reductase